MRIGTIERHGHLHGHRQGQVRKISSSANRTFLFNVVPAISKCYKYATIIPLLSNHEIIKRTEVKRQQNQRVIQKLLDEDIESKKDEWEKILGLKFNVRFMD